MQCAVLCVVRSSAAVRCAVAACCVWCCVWCGAVQCVVCVSSPFFIESSVASTSGPMQSLQYLTYKTDHPTCIYRSGTLLGVDGAQRCLSRREWCVCGACVVRVTLLGSEELPDAFRNRLEVKFLLHTHAARESEVLRFASGGVKASERRVKRSSTVNGAAV